MSQTKEKKHQASVMFHKSFYKKIEELAKQEDRSVASWIRQLVIAEVNSRT